MKLTENERIYCLRDDKGGVVIQDLEFRNCEFWNCHVISPAVPENRSLIRNISLHSCKAQNCSLDGAILEGVTIHNFSSSDLFIMFGTLFRHTKLSGRVGSIKINSLHSIVHASGPAQARFDDDRESFYRQGPWALDISAARFRLFEYEGIPASLFIRDPESQPLFRRSTVEQFDWQSEIAATSWGLKASLGSWMENHRQVPDKIFVVPLDSKKDVRDRLLFEIGHLRRIGLAEPN